MPEKNALVREVLLFVQAGCPYCRQALAWMEELFTTHPEFRQVPLRIVDENREADLARKYDYYYVPTYYVDGVKVHEGAATAAIIEHVFTRARG